MDRQLVLINLIDCLMFKLDMPCRIFLQGFFLAQRHRPVPVWLLK